jgi:hypothetical protein
MQGGETVMAKEAFLIGNPPKRAPKKKKSNVGLKRHRILAFEGKGGGMFTSAEAKIVRPGIKINPFRKNPLFGEELMFIGANPQRKRGEFHMAKKKTHHKKFKKAAKKHRSFRMNPVSYMDKGLAMGVGGAVVGAIGARMIPNLLKLTGWKGNLAQLGVGVLGLVLGSKMDKEAGTGIMLGAAAILGTDLTAGVLATASAAAAPMAVQGFEYAQPQLAGPYTEDPYNTPAMGGYEVAY